LHEISNDNGVRVVNFATSKNLTVKSKMFPHHNIHKVTWRSLDGKMGCYTLIKGECMNTLFIFKRRHVTYIAARQYWNTYSSRKQRMS
jgi:hypothetical protein